MNCALWVIIFFFLYLQVSSLLSSSHYIWNILKSLLLTTPSLYLLSTSLYTSLKYVFTPFPLLLHFLFIPKLLTFYFYPNLLTLMTPLLLMPYDAKYNRYISVCVIFILRYYLLIFITLLKKFSCLEFHDPWLFWLSSSISQCPLLLSLS